MVADLVISVAIAVSVSFLCSMMESALYAVGAPYVRNLSEKGSGAGRILTRFKEDIDRPIAAILILNTLANTAGAVVAGAAAEEVFQGRHLILFSGVFTLLILFLGEIMPKVLGVTYHRVISRGMAYPLLGLTFAFFPLIWLTRLISSRIRKPENYADAPEDEVHAMARISAEEGSILPIEQELIINALKLNDVISADLMTPRTVMFSKPAHTTLSDVAGEVHTWVFARIPIYAGNDPEEIIGMVLRRDVISAIARGDTARPLADFAHSVHFVPETLPAHKLLAEFIKRRKHLFVVIDEYGGVAGVVSLEDVLEFLIGEEIVDEFDTAEDMQELARRNRDEAVARRLEAQPREDVPGSEPPPGRAENS